MEPRLVLRVSVRDLVAYALRRGDLDLTTFGAITAGEGIMVHQRVQSSRPAEYRSEVPISHTVERETYAIEISGRMDGIMEETRPVRIEEIKSTKQDLAELEPRSDPLHWAQAKVYAHVYAQQHDLDEIEIQLTYYHVVERTALELRCLFTRAELALFFAGIIETFATWARTLVDWTCLRDASIAQMTFPFSLPRPGQSEIMKRVARTIRSGEHLLIQAPTGIGKTLAVLMPAIQAIPDEPETKVFFLTARTTGKTAAEKAVAQLRERGLRIKALTLTAKERICFNPDRLCNGQDCVYARGYYDRINAAVHDAFQNDALDRETIVRVARSHQVCPFELSLDLAISADIIICDYNYVFDPRAYLRRFFDESAGRFLVLVDEAHNLLERGRDMFSAALSKSETLALRRAVRGELSALGKRLTAVNKWFLDEQHRHESLPAAEKEPPADIGERLLELTNEAADWLALNRRESFREALLEYYFNARRFLRGLEIFDETFATVLSRTDDDLQVKLFCIDPAPHLRRALARASAAVFFSGTLNPPEFFRLMFGCAEDSPHLSLASPFEQANQCVICADSISTLFKHRTRTCSAVSNAIRALIAARGGNYLVFVPSYEYLNLLSRNFAATARTGVRILVQSAAMAESERERFICEFSTAAAGASLVGFAVLGGPFAESIDLIGERLAGVVVVGVGLPPVSIERELVRQYYEAAELPGTAFAYQYPGMIKVLQAAGRVIRSETDRGVILLIDQRYRTQPYAGLLPEHWSIVRAAAPDRIREVAHRFWARRSP